MELLQILLNFLCVFRVGDTIHARAGILPQILECLVQCFHRQKMSDR